MKKRQWTNQQKAQIILEGLSGQIEISKLCNKYQIAQTQYYKWRDLFLKESHTAFEVKKQSQKEQRLEAENSKLKRIIGDLTIELKKTSSYDEKTPLPKTHRTRPKALGQNQRIQENPPLLGLPVCLGLPEQPKTLQNR